MKKNSFRKNRLKLIIALAIFLLPITIGSNYVFATCIIIHVGSNEIIIGADSRNVKTPTGSDKKEITDACKIQKMGTFFVAMSGFTNSSFYEFNSYEIVNRHLQDRKDINIIKENIKTDLKSKLSPILKKIKTNKTRWEMIVTFENRILDLAIIGEINDDLVVYRLGIIISNPETIELEFSEEEIVSNYETNKYVAFGELDVASDYLIDNLNTDIPQNLIRNAIKEQVKAGKITVGEPINILKIQKEKYEWIDNYTCEK